MAHTPIDASAGEHAHLDQQEPVQRFVDDLDASSDDDPGAYFVADIDKASVARPDSLDSLMAHNAALRFEHHSALLQLERSPLFKLEQAINAAVAPFQNQPMLAAARAARRLADPDRAARQLVEPVAVPPVVDEIRSVQQLVGPLAVPPVVDEIRSVQKLVGPLAVPPVVDEKRRPTAYSIGG